MRMKGFEIRFETRIKGRILNAPIQRKEMKMPLAAAATSSPRLLSDTTGLRAIAERVTRPSSPEEGACVKFDTFIGYRARL